MYINKYVSSLVLFTVSFLAHASNTENWETVSDIGAYGLVGIALTVPVYKKDWEGFRQAGYSVATAAGTGLLTKSLVEEERPDKSGNDSFPSNHTAIAFAAATTLELRYGWKVGLPAYGISTLAGVGRVEGNKHYWKDVLAGAIIGSVAGWLFTDQFDEHVLVFPWVSENETGLSFSISY